MISLREVVYVVVWLLAAGLIFGLLFWLADYFASQFPNLQPVQLAAKLVKVALVILGVLMLIGFLVSLVGGPPLMRW